MPDISYIKPVHQCRGTAETMTLLSQTAFIKVLLPITAIYHEHLGLDDRVFNAKAYPYEMDAMIFDAGTMWSGSPEYVWVVASRGFEKDMVIIHLIPPIRQPRGAAGFEQTLLTQSMYYPYPEGIPRMAAGVETDVALATINRSTQTVTRLTPLPVRIQDEQSGAVINVRDDEVDVMALIRNGGISLVKLAYTGEAHV